MGSNHAPALGEKKTFLSQLCWLKWSSAVNEDPGLSPAGRWTIFSSPLVQKSPLTSAVQGQVSDLQIESSGPNTKNLQQMMLLLESGST